MTDTHNVANVCDAIAQLDHLTTVDALNVMRALLLRQAQTPLQQQGRADVAKVLACCFADLANVWSRDQK